MKIICNAQWLFGANFQFLESSVDFTRRQINFFKQDNTFKQTRVDFLPRKYDVITQLRHSYAKGPFCVARLNSIMRQTKSDHNGVCGGPVSPRGHM